jgi:hypothetical protein
LQPVERLARLSQARARDTQIEEASPWSLGGSPFAWSPRPSATASRGTGADGVVELAVELLTAQSVPADPPGPADR